MEEGFLDSSVLWAYVGPREFEPRFDPCVAIFDSVNVVRFTSETVRGEVRRSERHRANLYADLIAHFREKRRPEDFPADRYGRHVAARARELVRRLRMNRADVEYFRRLGQLERARLRQAWSAIQHPLVPSARDPYLEDVLRSRLDMEMGDARILTDFLVWAGGRGSKFVTADDRFLAAVRESWQAFRDGQYDITISVDDFLEPESFQARL